jgi:antitoxin ParD1/3/4
MTINMNISMPDSLKSFIDERVKSRGYGSDSEYLRDLVRKDEIEAAKEKLRGLIEQGLNSPVNRSWDELKADLILRTQRNASK